MLKSSVLVQPTSRGLDPRSALDASISTLPGVSQSVADALADVGISSVFDLATSETFANAFDIRLLGDSGQGRFAAIGRVPCDVLRTDHETPYKELPGRSISILGTPWTAPQREALVGAMNVFSIGDLAAWPPYVLSRDLLDRVYNPSTGNSHGESAVQEPADLMPAAGQYPTERVQYEVLLFDSFAEGPGSRTDRLAVNRSYKNRSAAETMTILRPLGSDGPLDLSQLLSNEGYDLPAIGGVLTFTQSWYTKGLSLGNLIHSVALAPGESTRIAMIDWSRKTSASAAESISQRELLDSDVLRSRAINEITTAVAIETQQGSSGASNTAESEQKGEAASGAKLDDLSMSDLEPFNKGVKSPGVSTSGTSGGKSKGSTSAMSWSTTSGQRDVAAELSQDIVDRTHQASHSVRNRRAAIVREVSQAESERITTRTITNYNHMHALTVEYYEVVQLYRTIVELSKADRCVFVPMKLVDFSSPWIVERYRDVIAASGLRGDVRLLSVSACDHLALFAPLRCRPWNPTALFNAQRWLGTGVGAPTDPVLSFPSSFAFSDVYFDAHTPFDALIVTLASGESITLPLAVEVIGDTPPRDASTPVSVATAPAQLTAAPRKATALRVTASSPTLNNDLVDVIRIVLGEKAFQLASREDSSSEKLRFTASTVQDLDLQLDPGVSIGLTWKSQPGDRSGDLTGTPANPTRQFDDVRFEAKISGVWVPIAAASSLSVPLDGRGTTTISPLPASSAPHIATTLTPQTPQAAAEPPGPLAGSLHLKVDRDPLVRRLARRLFDERLHEVRSLAARKKEGSTDFSGRISIGLFADSEDRSLRPLSWWIDVPKGSASVVLLEIQPTATTNELIDHLMTNQLYYSQAVWRALSPATIGMLLSRYTWPNGGRERPLVEMVDPTPVAIVANYLVLRLSGDDSTEREAWLDKKKIFEGSCREDLIPVPSGGVFAEAVLGRSNSAEKLDITRFWNWQDSPIPIQAPDIAAIQAGSRRDADNVAPGQLGAPVLNIVNPPSLPDPQGMGAILAAIQNGNMFRDMSGLAATIGLAQAGLADAQQGASHASNQAGKNAEVAAQLGAKIAETAARMVTALAGKGAPAGSGGGGQDRMINAEGGISKTGSMLNYGRDMDRSAASHGYAGNGSSSSPGPGGEGARPARGSGAGSDSYVDSTTPSAGNERAAFHAALGGTVASSPDFQLTSSAPTQKTGVRIGASRTTSPSMLDAIGKLLDMVIDLGSAGLASDEENLGRALSDAAMEIAKKEIAAAVDVVPFGKVLRLALRYSLIFAEGAGKVIESAHEEIQGIVDEAARFSGDDGISDESKERILRSRTVLAIGWQRVREALAAGLQAAVDDVLAQATDKLLAGAAVSVSRGAMSNIVARLLSAAKIDWLYQAVANHVGNDVPAARRELYSALSNKLVRQLIKTFAGSKAQRARLEALVPASATETPLVSILRGLVEITVCDVYNYVNPLAGVFPTEDSVTLSDAVAEEARGAAHAIIDELKAAGWTFSVHSGKTGLMVDETAQTIKLPQDSSSEFLTFPAAGERGSLQLDLAVDEAALATIANGLDTSIVLRAINYQVAINEAPGSGWMTKFTEFAGRTRDDAAAATAAFRKAVIARRARYAKTSLESEANAALDAMARSELAPARVTWPAPPAVEVA